ncbi:glycerate kinase [Bacteroides faecalis]|uniref:Glycerate kinase n=1 Tax=Bacteroides faecalis TaxID=2447885 RepID=A0A401LXS9_9BACE|nr:glycerate kinase [Bacteroides faecalis]GCB36297.1 glycerate kinase [Bacteroides faecalis]
MKKVVVAMDSFKGCLSSAEVEKAAEEGIKKVCPDCDVILIPIADGGEGILEISVEATHGTYREVFANDPLMRQRKTCYGISGDGETALIEMAAVNGLPLLMESERNPMLTTTFGTGELILDALEYGCRKFIIGIGGSATNDAGLGMLQALGIRLFDVNGNILGVGGKVMRQVATIDCSSLHPALKDSHFTIACDVCNSFCGPQGAAYIFARQKGANSAMIEELDAGMYLLSKVIESVTGKIITHVPGAGAAGGLGGAFLAFLNAELKSGIDLLFQMLNFAERIRGADLIITGEGRIDRQSIMGKVPSGVLQEARKQSIPVVAVVGSVKDSELLRQIGFQGIFSILSAPMSLEKAMEPDMAKSNISQTVAQVISLAECFQTPKNEWSIDEKF